MNNNDIENISNTINMRLSLLTGLGTDITKIYLKASSIPKLVKTNGIITDQTLKENIFNINLKYNPCVIKCIDKDVTTFGLIIKKDNTLEKEGYKISYLTSHLTTIYFNEDRKPRLYIDCPFYKECDQKYEAKYKDNGKPLCMKSIRTQYQCKKLEHNLTFMNQLITVLNLIAMINEYINNKKITYKRSVITDKTKNNTNNSVITDKTNSLE